MVTVLQVLFLLLLLICCVALQRQGTRNHLTHQQTLTSLREEIFTLQKQLALLDSSAMEEENLSLAAVKTGLSLVHHDSDSGHTPHQPLTLSSSQGMSHDHVSMATETSTGSVTDEPDTAPAALLAAMATRPHPLKQQSQQPQQVTAAP